MAAIFYRPFKKNVYISIVSLYSFRIFSKIFPNSSGWLLRPVHLNTLSTISVHSKQTTHRIIKETQQSSAYILSLAFRDTNFASRHWSDLHEVGVHYWTVMDGGCHVKDSCSPLPMCVRVPHAWGSGAWPLTPHNMSQYEHPASSLDVNVIVLFHTYYSP